MERLVEFSINHWELVGLAIGLVIALIYTEARKSGKTISSQELTHLLNREAGVVLDIREAKEFREGHITGAINIPYASFNERWSVLEPHKEKPVVIVCKMGQHSGAIGKILKEKGFTDIRRLSGGIATWQGDNLPLVKE